MRTINISASETISKSPECFNVTVHVDSTLQQDIAKANELADKAIENVKTYCINQGIQPKDIQLLNYQNQAIYKTEEKYIMTRTGSKEVVREKKLTGYQTTATLFFIFDFDMKRAGVMFQELGDIKNISYNMEYALKNPEEYKMEVLALAVKKARKTADVIAIAADTKVKAIQEISHEYEPSYSTRAYKGKAMMDCCSMESAISDLGVQSLTISATISAIFEIE